MKRVTQKSRQIMVIGLVAWFRICCCAFAGDLEPPAAPAPTMKTLDEVEPRISIPASATPTATFVINSAGSYYLAGDRHTSANGIQVNVDNVTIDLMGYQLIGTDSGSADGVGINGRTNVEVRNGTIRDFGQYGIYDYNTNSKCNRVINVRVISNKNTGIYLRGYTNTIKDCTVAENGDRGIDVTYSSIVTGCTLHNNTSDGINLAYGCTILNCILYNNGSYGIWANNGCNVRGNTAYLHANNYGIRAYAGCTVIGNNAYDNKAGIYAGVGAIVLGNSAYNNTEAGFYFPGNALLDNNTTYSNNPNMSIGVNCSVGLNHAP